MWQASQPWPWASSSSSSSGSSLCLCGECDDSGECISGSASSSSSSSSSEDSNDRKLWTSGGPKPQSLTIKWIGSGPAPNSIDVRFKKKPRGIQQVFGTNGIYFFEKPPVCRGCNNLYISDSNAAIIATLHISCSNTLYIGQEFGRGSGSGNDNACVGSCTPIFKIVGACVPNGSITQCTGDQTGNPNVEGQDYEFSTCSAPTLEPAPSPSPTEDLDLGTPVPTSEEPTVSGRVNSHVVCVMQCPSLISASDIIYVSSHIRRRILHPAQVHLRQQARASRRHPSLRLARHLNHQKR